jgi:ribokinase
MPDVACIGSSLVDIFLHIHNASNYCSVDESGQKLCVAFGEKIPLENTQIALGGNACNVAVGLSRLGVRSSLIAEIGTDEFSERIVHTLEQEQVDMTHMLRVNGKTSTGFGIQFKNERTLFVEHIPRAHAFSFDDIHTPWIYLTSVGTEWHHVYRDITNLVTQKQWRVALNPGTPQLEEGLSVLTPVLAKTEIVFLNKEEAMHLLGMNERTQIEQLLAALQDLGPKIVVVTDGQNGSFAYDHTKVLMNTPIASAPVVEKTGAGDAFATGFLAAYVKGKSVKEAMQWGTLNAASVIGFVGAQQGLLTHAELEKRSL